MKIKLTRDDFEGYKSRIVMAQKINLLEREQNELILDWIEKKIQKCPKIKDINKK